VVTAYSDTCVKTQTADEIDSLWQTLQRLCRVNDDRSQCVFRFYTSI